MTDHQGIRIDKWVWAARFFKTRSEAQRQVELGRVTVNNDRVKVSRLVRLGDVLQIKAFHGDFVVEVKGLSDKRGPASEAQLLYQETAESRKRRAEVDQASAAPLPSFEGRGRPTKKDRRNLIRLKDG